MLLAVYLLEAKQRLLVSVGVSPASPNQELKQHEMTSFPSAPGKPTFIHTS